MKLLSATDLALAAALKAGTLSVTERASRFAGETFFALADDFGLIEVALTSAEAEARLADIRQRAGL